VAAHLVEQFRQENKVEETEGAGSGMSSWRRNRQ